MTHPATIRVEWSYKPADFFESDDEIAHAGFRLDRARGVISFEETAEQFDSSPDRAKALGVELTNRLLAIQLLARKRFVLEALRVMRLGADSGSTISVQLEGSEVAVATDGVHVVKLDADGNTVFDSKAQAIAERVRLSHLSSKYLPEDRVLGAMLRSYDMSVRDSANELVHLYEIWDALASWPPDRKKVHSLLGTKPEMESRFQHLCNLGNLRQGRHRGQGKAPRDATAQELAEARSIALAFVEAYLNYRERGATPTEPRTAPRIRAI